MIALVELKKQILDYKKTNDSTVFAEILANVDYLILYFIKKLKSRLPYVRNQEMTELYHTSIIALYNAIHTFPDNMSARYIPCRLRAYMIAEFSKTYAYLRKEYALEASHYCSNQRTHSINLKEIDCNLALADMSEEEAEVMNHYLKKTKTLTDLAKEKNVCTSTLTHRIKQTIKRIKR